MITYEKINGTHFNILRDGKVFFSGVINQYVLLKGGFENKSVIIKSLLTDKKIEIKISETAETNMNGFISSLASIVFDSYIAPSVMGTDYIYDSLACFVVSKNKYAIDMIAIKGSLVFDSNNIFGKTVINFKTLKGDYITNLSMSSIEALTLFNDDVKSILLVESSITSNTLYKEVEFSAAEILTFNSVGYTLLDSPGANNYYEIDKIILEYTHVTTAYTIADDNVIIIFDDNGYLGSVNPGFLGSVNSYAVVDQTTGQVMNTSVTYQGTQLYGMSNSLWTDSAIGIGTATLDPIGGDGTLKVIIKYRIRTFGV